MPETSIESSMQETRRFPPPSGFVSRARVGSMAEYRRLYERSVSDPDGFWREQADALRWHRPFTSVLTFGEPSGAMPDSRWFDGGTLNASENCLDRVIDLGHGDKIALIWEGEPVGDDARPRDIRRLTYRQLRDDVCRFANGLKSLGVGKGDVVTIYLPLVPEAVVAMLACARIGAAHSVIFGGFSSQAIADRVADAKSRVIVTADGGYRRGNVVPLKANVDAACAVATGVRKVVVLKRTGAEVAWTPGRDVGWHELVAHQPDTCDPEPCDSEHVLFVLYTSGSTGKPKGIVHTTAGYLLWTHLTSKYVFDLRDDDVYWCTADVGWITGHSYLVYGPLSHGATCFLYEGAPNYPDFSRFWGMIERHKVSVFYTAPTAIRAFMKAGKPLVGGHDLSSLRLLGTVGEPINPEAWMWYHETIGGGRCPIVDTWWQTETGGHMITPLPGATPTKPGTATLPFFGVDAAIVDRDGRELPANEGGLLVIRKPWPGMLRGVLDDRERYETTYWSDVPGVYFTGDGARRDDDGYFWIMGRIDDVLNVSGHRLGTAEIESALVSHPAVAEAAVVGVPHEVKGQAVAAFVMLRGGFTPDEDLRKQLATHVATQIGALARPDTLRFAEALPKTRSGKIMRRLLKQIAAGAEVTGDVTTLEDFNVLASLSGTEE